MRDRSVRKRSGENRGRIVESIIITYGGIVNCAVGCRGRGGFGEIRVTLNCRRGCFWFRFFLLFLFLMFFLFLFLFLFVRF